jgi:hypothetical protein
MAKAKEGTLFEQTMEALRQQVPHELYRLAVQEFLSSDAADQKSVKAAGLRVVRLFADFFQSELHGRPEITVEAQATLHGLHHHPEPIPGLSSDRRMRVPLTARLSPSVTVTSARAGVVSARLASTVATVRIFSSATPCHVIPKKQARPVRAGRADGRSHLKIHRSQLAALLLHVIGDLLAIVETIQACTLDGADMNEDVLSAAVGLDKAETLCGVEPLHRACSHVRPSGERARESAVPV